MNELEWIEEISHQPPWGDDEFDMHMLNEVKFRAKGPNEHLIFRFGTDKYDEVYELNSTYNKMKKKRPQDVTIIYEDGCGISSRSGSPWTWDEIRQNFIDGRWYVT